MRLYYTGCSFWVHRQLVLPPIKIVWSLLLQVLFLTPAKISRLKFSTMSAWEFLLVCWGEKYNLWILFCSHARPIPFSRMNFSLLELNLNSNSAQMAIVLRHIFHSSQASRFIKLPKFKHFHTLNYLGLHLGKSLPLPASVSIQIYIWSSQELKTQPVPQQVALVREYLNQHHPVPEHSLLLKTSPFNILQSGQKAIHHPQLTYFKALPIYTAG